MQRNYLSHNPKLNDCNFLINAKCAHGLRFCLWVSASQLVTRKLDVGGMGLASLRWWGGEARMGSKESYSFSFDVQAFKAVARVGFRKTNGCPHPKEQCFKLHRSVLPNATHPKAYLTQGHFFKGLR